MATLTLRNYRCFDWGHPARIEFGPGFRAIVGPNNSGKSAAIRSVYELRQAFSEIARVISPGNSFRGSAQLNGVADYIEIANEKDRSRIQFTLDVNLDDYPRTSSGGMANSLTIELDVTTSILTPFAATTVRSDGRIVNFSAEAIRSADGQLNSATMTYPTGESADFSAILSFAQELGESVYFPAFRNAINEGAGNYYDIPVGTGLVAAWDSWKAGNSISYKDAISLVQNDIAKLLGFDRLEINADQTNKTLDVIIDGKSHKLHEVGAGVAQLIIVLAAALVKRPRYILIDEPEISLHPSLQIKFLATLASYAKSGVVFATHSIGLARSTASQIMSVRRLVDGGSAMAPFADDKVNLVEWLGELGYSARVELGCEGLILVEGPSEILLFQEFLRMVNKDHRFTLMQVGGSSMINARAMIQLKELTRLVAPENIRVFVDSERSSESAVPTNDRREFIRLCGEIGIRAQLSERRATENYLTDTAIKKAFGPDFVALGKFDLLKDLTRSWKKSDNWRVVRNMRIEEIAPTDLGKFLADL